MAREIIALISKRSKLAKAKMRIVVTQGDNLSWVAELQKRKRKRWHAKAMASGHTPLQAVWRLVGRV